MGSTPASPSYIGIQPGEDVLEHALATPSSIEVRPGDDPATDARVAYNLTQQQHREHAELAGSGSSRSESRPATDDVAGQ